MSKAPAPEKVFTAPSRVCGCDPERFRFGWVSCGCQLHGLASAEHGWRGAAREERTALTAWEAMIK